jgi:hypothetical protein
LGLHDGAERRHEVEFRHNTLPGQRLLWIDGSMVFKSGVRYRLTGSVTFFLDASSQARISITPHGTLDLNYALAVNDKLIELGKAAAGTVWVFDGPANSTSTDAAAPGASATSAAASSATGSVASPSLAGESQRFEVEFGEFPSKR